MGNNQNIGKVGEDFACEFISKNGYKVLQRNYRKPWGEIDIIGRSNDGTLIFFEVKTLNARGENSLIPEDNLTFSKLQKLRRTCDMFVAKHCNLIIEDKGWRIDLLSIALGAQEDEYLTKNNKNVSINHYENI